LGQLWPRCREKRIQKVNADGSNNYESRSPFFVPKQAREREQTLKRYKGDKKTSDNPALDTIRGPAAPIIDTEHPDEIRGGKQSDAQPNENEKPDISGRENKAGEGMDVESGIVFNIGMVAEDDNQAV
jgi:hypothetical protein